MISLINILNSQKYTNTNTLFTMTIAKRFQKQYGLQLRKQREAEMPRDTLRKICGSPLEEQRHGFRRSDTEHGKAVQRVSRRA